MYNTVFAIYEYIICFIIKQNNIPFEESYKYYKEYKI